MANKSLKSSCHCGGITIVVPRLPDEINECQCTICRRYAAAWTYYKVDEIKFELKEGAKLSEYIWGDKQIIFNFCDNCGCVCHWWPVEEKTPDGGPSEFGLNTRNMDPMEILHVNRKIDNSWLFQPLENGSMAHEQDRAQY